LQAHNIHNGGGGGGGGCDGGSCGGGDSGRGDVSGNYSKCDMTLPHSG